MSSCVVTFPLLQDVGVCWRPQHGAVLLAVGGAVGLAVFEAKPEVRHASAACSEPAVVDAQWLLKSLILDQASGQVPCVVSHMQQGTAGGSAAAQDWCLRRVCTLAGRLPVCAVAFGGSRAARSGAGDNPAAAHSKASLACACLDGSLFVWDLSNAPLDEMPLRLQVTFTYFFSCTAPLSGSLPNTGGTSATCRYKSRDLITPCHC